jgi:hypothetical protein
MYSVKWLVWVTLDCMAHLNSVMWTEEMKDQWNWEIVIKFVKEEVSILILCVSAGGNSNWVQADVITAQKGGCTSSGDSCLREMGPFVGTILTTHITEFRGVHHFLPWGCCVCKIAAFSSLPQCQQQTSSSLGWVVLSVNALVLYGWLLLWLLNIIGFHGSLVDDYSCGIWHCIISEQWVLNNNLLNDRIIVNGEW